MCSAALRADLPAFLEHMAEAGVDVADSRLLPGEFVRVAGGLQQLLSRTVVTSADCQVRVHAPCTRNAEGGKPAPVRLPLPSQAALTRAGGTLPLPASTLCAARSIAGALQGA